MNTSLKLTIVLLFAGFVNIVQAQKTDTTLFNGVTKIIINNDKTAAENYKLAGSILLDQGYNIGAKDSEFFQISSEPIKLQVQGAAHMLSLYSVCKDNQIIITGKSKNLTSTNIVSWQQNNSPVEVLPFKKLRPLTKLIYAKLSTFAGGFGGRVTYSE